MPLPLGNKKGRMRMKYGLQRVWTDEGWTKAQHCILVVSVCVAGITVCMTAWAVVTGWTAVIERLVAR